ncbi:hypothetical protein GQF49_00745 [Microbacter sp. ANSKLAB05]|nr:hypothetical protein [Microbacter sp. ANSKLAB05]
MEEKTFVALSGAFGLLFLSSTAWTAWEVATHGAEKISAPVFPALTLGALVGVVVMRIGRSHLALSTAATALVGAMSFATATAAGLWVWFLTAG